MYELVTNISSYPDFVAYCKEVSMLNQEHDGKDCWKMTLGYSSVSVSMTTENEYVYNKSIHMRMVEGPFSFFDGQWSFDQQEELKETCYLSLRLRFEINSWVISSMVSSDMWQPYCDQLLDQFVQRAHELYGG